MVGRGVCSPRGQEAKENNVQFCYVSTFWQFIENGGSKPHRTGDTTLGLNGGLCPSLTRPTSAKNKSGLFPRFQIYTFTYEVV
jgi:hypothetical protein